MLIWTIKFTLDGIYEWQVSHKAEKTNDIDCNKAGMI